MLKEWSERYSGSEIFAGMDRINQFSFTDADFEFYLKLPLSELKGISDDIKRQLGIALLNRIEVLIEKERKASNADYHNIVDVLSLLDTTSCLDDELIYLRDFYTYINMSYYERENPIVGGIDNFSLSLPFGYTFAASLERRYSGPQAVFRLCAPNGEIAFSRIYSFFRNGRVN